jgi:NTP pyrophosphatase (non-canonical NTP hydrolase)
VAKKLKSESGTAKYSEAASRVDRNYDALVPTLTDSKLRLLNGAMGLAGETGELVDQIKKHIFYGKALDITNVREELGDILWYMHLIVKESGSSFDELMELNIAKLQKRYPQGFSETAALARADKTESNIERAAAEVATWPTWKIENMKNVFSEPDIVVPTIAKGAAK